MEDYPRTVAEFEARFSTKEACRHEAASHIRAGAGRKAVIAHRLEGAYPATNSGWGVTLFPMAEK
jgi:hypothetical protein